MVIFIYYGQFKDVSGFLIKLEHTFREKQNLDIIMLTSHCT